MVSEPKLPTSLAVLLPLDCGVRLTGYLRNKRRKLFLMFSQACIAACSSLGMEGMHPS